MGRDYIFQRVCVENYKSSDRTIMMKNHPLLNIVIRSTLVCLLLVNISSIAGAANSKTEELQRKIADIRLLQQQLEDRRQQAETVLKSLSVQQGNLASEVRLLQRSFDFKSYQQVQNNDRARYNIELLRNILAYSEAFFKKIKIYQTGNDKLNYLLELAEDDIKMMRTLSDFQIDALATQISLVINKYLHEAHIIQIDPKNIKPPSPEKVWEGIVAGRY